MIHPSTDIIYSLSNKRKKHRLTTHTLTFFPTFYPSPSDNSKQPIVILIISPFWSWALQVITAGCLDVFQSRCSHTSGPLQLSDGHLRHRHCARLVNRLTPLNTRSLASSLPWQDNKRIYINLRAEAVGVIWLTAAGLLSDTSENKLVTESVCRETFVKGCMLSGDGRRDRKKTPCSIIGHALNDRCGEGERRGPPSFSGHTNRMWTTSKRQQPSHDAYSTSVSEMW